MGLYRAQFISMILMIALGIGIFVGFNMEWVSIKTNTEHFFSETGFADYRIVAKEGFSKEELAKIKGMTTEEVIRITEKNAKRFYRISEENA